jgi:hypothetical protein
MFYYFLAFIFIFSTASAGIVSTSPNVNVITPTSSTNWTQGVTPTTNPPKTSGPPFQLDMFVERTSFPLSGNLSLNKTLTIYPFTYNAPSSDGSFIPSGTVINSYVHHVDASTIPGIQNFNGTITLDTNETIVGIIATSGPLSASNSSLGITVGGGPGVIYSSNGLHNSSGTDQVIVNSANSYTFNLFAGQGVGVDHFRIITTNNMLVPEPSTYLVLTSFLALVLFVFGRINAPSVK